MCFRLTSQMGSVTMTLLSCRHTNAATFSTERVTSSASDNTLHIARQAQFVPWFIVCLKELGSGSCPMGSTHTAGAFKFFNFLPIEKAYDWSPPP